MYDDFRLAILGFGFQPSAKLGSFRPLSHPGLPAFLLGEIVIRPWLKFYVRDWIGDMQLRQCSIAARGLWFELLCVMHCAKRPGYLESASGKALTDEALCTLIGVSKGDLCSCMAELLSHDVPSVTPDGTWFNRRMVRDRAKSEKCSEAGAKGGGNPTLKSEDQIPDTRIPEYQRSLKRSPQRSPIKVMFQKPTTEEVAAYAASVDFPSLDAEAFVSFYESKGWRVGNQAMKSWQSAVITWKKRHGSNGKHTDNVFAGAK